MELLVEEVMNRNIKSVRPDVMLPDLERRFVNDKVSGLPVVDEGTLRGVVSRSDVLRHLCRERSDAEVASGFYQDGYGSEMPLPTAEWISESVGKQMDHLRVRDVMIRQLITVAPLDSLLDAARKIIQEEYTARGIYNVEVSLGHKTMTFEHLSPDGSVSGAA